MVPRRATRRAIRRKVYWRSRWLLLGAIMVLFFGGAACCVLRVMWR